MYYWEEMWVLLMEVESEVEVCHSVETWVLLMEVESEIEAFHSVEVWVRVWVI